MLYRQHLSVIVVLFKITLINGISVFQNIQDWDGNGCPSGVTGQFPHALDCRKFYNCWKGRGMLTVCAPGTLFNAKTLECDFPDKAICSTDQLARQKSYAGQEHYSSLSQLPFEQQELYAAIDNQKEQSSSPQLQQRRSRGYDPHPYHHHHDHQHPYHHHHDHQHPYHHNHNHQHPYHHNHNHNFHQQDNNPQHVGRTDTQQEKDWSGQNSGGVNFPYKEDKTTPEEESKVYSSIDVRQSQAGYFPNRDIEQEKVPFFQRTLSEDFNSHQRTHQSHAGVQPPYNSYNFPRENSPGQNPNTYELPYQRPSFAGSKTPTAKVAFKDSERSFQNNQFSYNKNGPDYPDISTSFQNKGVFEGDVSQKFVPDVDYSQSFKPNIPKNVSPGYGIGETYHKTVQTFDNEFPATYPKAIDSSSTNKFESDSYQSKKTTHSLFNPSVKEEEHYYDDKTTTTEVDAQTSRPSAITTYEKCPPYFTGLVAHPHCRKFLSCAHGRTYLMECSNGTRFNPELLMCDYIDKVDCILDELDFIDNSETKTYPVYINKGNDQNVDDTVQQSSKHSKTINNIHIDTTNSDNKPDRYNILHKPHPDNPQMRGFFIQPTEETSTLSPKELPKEENCEGDNCEYEDIIVDEQTTNINNNGTKQSFRPITNNKNEDNIIVGNQAIQNRQIVRLRGGPSQQEGYVEILISQELGWGMLCDSRNQWIQKEADIVCKTLGYSRGAELFWQGKPASDITSYSSNVAANVVRCTGFEESIMDCYLSDEKECQVEKDAVWTRCRSNAQSQCLPGEVSLFDRCYKLVIPNAEQNAQDLVGFSQGEAIIHCQALGGHLLNIMSQVENDFISEWLIRDDSIDILMTSGVGVSVMGMPIWIWEGSEDAFSYHNWWPGWRSAKSVAPQTHTSKALCIVMRRWFSCPDFETKTESRLCDAQYYFWDVEECVSMSNTLPYICKRPANKIGCIVGTGLNYRGGANVTSTGNLCLSWDSEEVLPLLRYQISDSDKKLTLSGHNYCRNVGSTDSKPWCFIKKNNSITKEYCDIPHCTKGVEKSAKYMDYKCGFKEFSCSNGECIPIDKVCNGKQDCTNGLDENNCTETMLKFIQSSRSKLSANNIDTTKGIPLNSCVRLCLDNNNCRSFSYNSKSEECFVSDSNVGLSGALVVNQENWSYYELKSKSLRCDGLFVCSNGKCLSNSSLCNNRDECGDKSDEKNCNWLKNEFKIKLVGSSTPNEGTIEVFAHGGWGLICDDQFDLSEADVACRHLGYPLGASQVKRHDFPNITGPGNEHKFLMDDVDCRGDEETLAECKHAGWGVHDCQPHEAAGVICKLTDMDCGVNYWQCHRTKECVPINFVCDGIPDCSDNSDEVQHFCQEPISVRLVGLGGESRSNKVTEGRLEVKKYGVWGTVCDDDFSIQEAQVVCNYLGFNGPARVYKDAAFGAGSGIIWLDQVHCVGNESIISDCMHDTWGQTNCRHNEDVSVACSPQKINVPEPEQDIGNYDSSIESNFMNIDDILPIECGIVSTDFYDVPTDFKPRVVSGFETTKGSYPWQASIRVKSVTGKTSHWCGAVVISKYHVLTAGHCLRDYVKSYYYVRAGDFDTELEEGSEQELEVDDLWIHPKLDYGTRLNNDIAIVKVKAPGFVFNKWISPACLPSKVKEITEYSGGTNCTISGWGSDGTPGSGFARTLHATWLQILPDQRCKSKEVYGSGAVTEGMFCAGSLTGGSDSCQGDSGGPFLCPKGDRLTLYGITSWGHGCGKLNSPGVYTKVHHYLDWIYKILRNSLLN